MSREYFSILGLAPGPYPTRDITRRFRALRAHLDECADPDNDAARAQREALYLAYSALRDPRRQAAYLHALETGTTPLREFRRLIAAALEGDLLRCSRRAMLLREGRSVGLSDFQTQLLIAEVQFGGAGSEDWQPPPQARPARRRARVGLRFAAVAALAVALFTAFERWLAPF